MKRIFASALCAVFGFAAFAEQLDHWELNTSAKTITDNIWTLAVDRIDSTKLTLTVNSPVTDGYPTDPTDPQELNFAKPIQDASDPTKVYDITSLGFATGTADSWKSNRSRPIIPSAWAGCIGRLVFPPTGSCKFTSLGDVAFACTTNLAEVVNFLPDEIKTLGNCTFRYSSVNQPLYLRGLVQLTGEKKCEYTFSESKITAVTFGPNLTVLNGGVEYRNVGPFTSSELEEIHFDPEMTGATMSGRYLFASSPKLKTIPDLSGFSTLSSIYVFNATGFTNDTMVIPASVTTFHGQFVSGAKIKNLVFEGLPPTTVSATLNSGTALTTYVPEKYKAEWAVWTDGGKEVDQASTTWCQAVAGSNYKKFPLIYEAKAGELGDWIYDATAHTVTDGTWTFAATNSGTQVTVYKWITYPATPSELDFTGTLTDANGYPYIFVALNTKFGKDDERHWVSGYGACKPTEASGSVSSLKYPETVISFGNQAFGCCTNLTSIIPMFGDWITSIGQGAFSRVPAAGDLKLKGLASVSHGAFSRCTNLTSVTFGPNLKWLCSSANSDANSGDFQGCTALTNIIFDANMSGCALATGGSSEGNQFYGCTNLTGTLDLSGFSVLGYTKGTAAENSLRRSFHGTRYDNVIVATNITRIARDVFLGMDCLTNVTFLGEPPLESSMTASGFAIYGAMDQKITTSIHKAYRDSWKPYSAGGIYSRGSTWESAYVAEGISLEQRPLVTIETLLPGFQIIVR